jgi:hypothetical protein
MEENEDRAVDDVRKLRHQVSEECGHEAARLVERYLRLQVRFADRLLADKTAAEVAGKDAA